MDKLNNLKKSIEYLEKALDKLERIDPKEDHACSILRRRENVKNLLFKYKSVKENLK